MQSLPPGMVWGSRQDEDDRLRAAMMIGAGALIGGLGLAWAVNRLVPRPYLAPGWPGSRPRWAPADKVGVGTVQGADRFSNSLVWFTLGHGAITEVFYPRMDHPCTRELAMAVSDGRRFASDERRDAEHRVEYLAEGVPAYRLINTCKQGHYQIEKTIIAHPHQGAVLQHTRFTPIRGSLEDYRLFAILNPHLGLRKRVGALGRIGTHKGRTMLFGERGDIAMAMAGSAPWRAASAGYVGSASDGRLDVLRHGRLTRQARYAPRGNVLLTGEIDLAACGGEFVLALGFGIDAGEAGHRALAGVRDDFGALLAEYIRDWRAWQEGLIPMEVEDPERAARDLYRTSTMVLRVHEGKSVPGAIVASLSIPWGEAFSDDPQSPGQGGYHMAWPRDLVQIGGALLAAGARDEARRALTFLRDSQEDDGHWPQNMWTSGATFWSGIQLGETSLVLLLADLLHREGALDDAELAGYWPMVRRAAAYLVSRGPSTQEERWEDERGFNPYTIGASIAALLVAAEMAEARGERREAEFLRETADAWYSSIDFWTYVENSEIARRVGVRGYYLRIAPPDDRGEPSKHDGHLEFWYQGPRIKSLPPAAIVSPDALAYVRFGVRSPDDARIVDSIRVIDAITRVETPLGPCWHRYNHDGYGEKADGSPFDGTHGQGRAWPLLAGERAHVELAAGRRDEAVRLLHAIERFAGASGLIPEQVWDTADIPERGLFFGRPSGSAMPLAWAHAEYIKLRRSLRDGRVYDLPPQTVRRYLVEGVESPHVLWRPEHRRRTLPAGKGLRIELNEPAVIRWEAAGVEVSTRDSGLGVHFADLATETLEPGAEVRFTMVPVAGRLYRGRMGDVVRIEGQAGTPDGLGLVGHNVGSRRHGSS